MLTPIIFSLESKLGMDVFNIVVGLFSVMSAIIAIISFIQARRVKAKTDEVETKLIAIQQHIQNISVTGGQIKAGGNIKAGQDIQVGGVVLQADK